MTNGGKSDKHALAWTDERRQQQRERIQVSKPWEKSTGAKTTEGKRITSKNRVKRLALLTPRQLDRVISMQFQSSKLEQAYRQADTPEQQERLKTMIEESYKQTKEYIRKCTNDKVFGTG